MFSGITTGDPKIIAQKLYEQAVATQEKQETKQDGPIFFQLTSGSSEEFSSALKEKLNTEKDDKKKDLFEKMLAKTFGADDKDWESGHLKIDEVIKRNYAESVSAVAPVAPQNPNANAGYQGMTSYNNPVDAMQNPFSNSGYIPGDFDPIYSPLGGLPLLRSEMGRFEGPSSTPIGIGNMTNLAGYRPQSNNVSGNYQGGRVGSINQPPGKKLSIDELKNVINQAMDELNVPQNQRQQIGKIMLNIFQRESGGVTNAMNLKDPGHGSFGLGQVNVTDWTLKNGGPTPEQLMSDPVLNAKTAIKILLGHTKHYGGDIATGLLGYAGVGNIKNLTPEQLEEKKKKYSYPMMI